MYNNVTVTGDPASDVWYQDMDRHACQ